MAVKPGAKPDEFFDELEIMSSASRVKYQNQKLSETVDHAYHHAPAIKKTAVDLT